MSVIIDYQYALLLGSRLELFKQVRTRLFNCRCPICGDSEKKRTLKRFYIYQNHKNGTKDYLSVACHNCGYNNPFGKFLKEFDPGLYSEYRLDVFKELGYSTGKPQADVEEQQEPTSNLAREASEPLETDGLDLPTIADLPPDHFARQYVASRRLPEWTYELLMYAENFSEQLKTFSLESELMELPADPRLIIPFYDEWGALKVIQGRALDPKSGLRYITLKKSEESTKVFGLDRVDRSRTTLVVEGPIDSLFLPNCVATADADLLSAGFGDIFIHDFEPRNREIMKRLKRSIEAGKRVVIPPDNFPHKDINDLVKDGGQSPRQIVEFIGKYCYSGLAARMRFSQYCRLDSSSW